MLGLFVITWSAIYALLGFFGLVVGFVTMWRICRGAPKATRIVLSSLFSLAGACIGIAAAIVVQLIVS